MKISVRVKESNAELQRAVLGIIAKQLTAAMMGALPGIEQQIKQVVRAAITTSPEYVDLVSPSGHLRGEFGVIDAAKDMETILDKWLTFYTAKVEPVAVVGNRLKGGLLIEAIDATFNDVQYSYVGRYYTKKHKVIPWLEWLLTAGQKVLIEEYKVLFKAGLPASRTKLAIMIKSKSGGYHASVINLVDDNMVTRAIKPLGPQIESIMLAELRKHL